MTSINKGLVIIHNGVLVIAKVALLNIDEFISLSAFGGSCLNAKVTDILSTEFEFLSSSVTSVHKK